MEYDECDPNYPGHIISININDETSICPITQEKIINKYITDCKHEFEEKNIKDWLTTKNTCPVCRCVLINNFIIDEKQNLPTMVVNIEQTPIENTEYRMNDVLYYTLHIGFIILLLFFIANINYLYFSVSIISTDEYILFMSMLTLITISIFCHLLLSRKYKINKFSKIIFFVVIPSYIFIMIMSIYLLINSMINYEQLAIISAIIMIVVINSIIFCVFLCYCK